MQSLADTIKAHGGSWCLEEDSGARIRYNQIEATASTHLAEFDAGKAGRKALVFLCVSNTIASAAVYFGLLLRGHAVLLLDKDIDRQLLERLAGLYEPDAIIHPDRENPVELRKPPHGPPPHPELSVLLSTSGSTGSPKLVCFSWAQLMANADAIAQYLSIDQREIPFAHLPFHYSYGLSVLHSHFIRGAMVRLSNHSIMQRDFWQAMGAANATSLPGVPFNYEITKRLRFPQDAVATLTTMTQAGGRLSAELVREFAERAKSKGQRFVVMYGQTEAGPRISYLPPDQAAARAGSIGLPIPGVRIELDAATGELICHSPSIMMGYAIARDDLQLGDRMHGTLATGDIAVRDEDGYLYIKGRSSRFLKIHGSRVGLDDVEAILTNEGYVAACVGREDWLCVALEGVADTSGVKTMLNEKLKVPPRSVSVVPVASIPRSAAGKVLYAQLLEQVGGEQNG